MIEGQEVGVIVVFLLSVNVEALGNEFQVSLFEQKEKFVGKRVRVGVDVENV